MYECCTAACRQAVYKPATARHHGGFADQPGSCRVHVQGYFDLRFETLRDAFAVLFDNPQQRGAALCVQVEGETVVDLWGGVADRDG